MTDNPNAAADNLLAALNRSLAVIEFSPSGDIIAKTINDIIGRNEQTIRARDQNLRRLAE